MKKRSVSLIFLFLFLALIFSACSSGSAINKNSQSSFNHPDFGQPEESPDLMGIVKSTSGNEITILKLDMPSAEDRQTNFNNQDQPSSSGNEDNKAPVFGSVSGEAGRVGGPGFGQRSGSYSQEDMLSKMKGRTSGEETLIIPVGIRMLKLEDNSDNKSRQMIEASLEDVKANSIISV
ncbi:MAG: hypothetical protein K9M44_04815 [Candidatus Pacebacteria bacterium]|nr:hypothetical protein [Candidatus Paceibacterota bacterium]